jgi:squalene-associated FAD-dependent desaturase
VSHILIAGGGLAGLASAAALGSAGFEVTVLESRSFLGGRATSYRVTSADETEETIDNCQHVLLKCCVNLLDFYRRLGVEQRIQFYKEFFFIEPGGRMSVMKAGRLPRPLHFAESFTTLRFLSFADKLAVGRGLLALQSERNRRTDLDRITMLDWLKEKGQTLVAIDRFWRQILVSAVNEELDRMAALHGFQVFWLGFLAARDSYEMGIPAVPLGDLYSEEAWKRLPNVNIRLTTQVTGIRTDGDRVTGFETPGGVLIADHYISALPVERLAALMPEAGFPFQEFENSPITGIHLWFDRPVTELPHGTLLDRTIQWFFNKGGGRYIQLVVSASRSLVPLSRQEIIDLALRELAEFLPAVRGARLVKAHVVKEVRATFSARPGLETMRPVARTRWRNFSLAGDWTRSGWPATMEGAVRSGYLGAEDAARALGRPGRFLLPDIA